MGDEIKVVILGDVGVGKTSLILTLVTEEFTPNPPKSLNRIGISNEVSSATEFGLTYLVDYSDENSEEILQDADAVCLCHPISDIESLFDSCERWLSYVRLQAFKSPPVIIVGTKADLIDTQKSKQIENSWREKCKALMSRYSEVASAMECSALENRGILSIFVDAQKCAIYPLCPVYNARSGKLTKEASNGLRRIFHIMDANHDGILDLSEMTELQRQVFNTHLGDQGYVDIRKLVKKSCPNGLVKQGILIEGFYSLQAQLCKNLKQEVVWTMLKAFGYTLDSGEVKMKINLSNLRLHPIAAANVMSSISYQFLSSLFDAIDVEKRGTMTQKQVQQLFHACESVPREFDFNILSTPISYSNSNACGDVPGVISFESFLARWELLMCLNPEKCIRLLIILGVVQSTLGLNAIFDARAVHQIVSTKVSIPGRPIHLAVTGDKYIGKSTIVNHMVRNKRFQQNATASKITISTSLKITLILQEVPLTDIDKINCDGILMAYSPYEDNSLTELFNALTVTQTAGILLPPVMLVRTRSDLHDAMSIGNDTPNQFIKKYCSFSSPELLFYGDSTPHVFYTRTAQFLLKAHGYYGSSRFTKKLFDCSQSLLQYCAETSSLKVISISVIGIAVAYIALRRR